MIMVLYLHDELIITGHVALTHSQAAGHTGGKRLVTNVSVHRLPVVIYT